MVLPQLDAYHAGRRMQQLQPWESVCLAHHLKLNGAGMAIPLVYNYAAYADVHVVTLCPDGAPILLFSDPTDLPVRTPWDRCVTGDLGSVESNVMAGRALLGVFQLANGGQRCALFVLLDKHICRAATKRPRLGLTGALPQRLWNWLRCLSVASTFCDRLLALHRGTSTYFDPAQDWPQPITSNPRMEVFMQRLYFLGNTRSRRELIVFAETNPFRLPLAMGIAQASIPVRRMAKMTGKVDCLML